MKRITKQMLTDKSACSGQVGEFDKRFPNGVTFKDTKDAVNQCVKVASVFDFDWAASQLLSPTLYEEYQKANALLWKEYLKAGGILWGEYQKAKAKVFAELYMEGT